MAPSNTETSQQNCYDSFGQMSSTIKTSSTSATGTTSTGDTCASKAPTPTTSSLYQYNEFGQEVAQTVPLASSSNGNQTVQTQTIYDALGRRVRTSTTLSGQATTNANFAYLGLSDDVSGGGGQSLYGTVYTNTYDNSSTGQPVGFYTSANNGAYYTYRTDANGSVTGLEDNTGAVANQDSYHYTPQGELELGSNQTDTTLTDLLGNQAPGNELNIEAQANQVLFEGFQYQLGGTSPAGLGSPSADSYQMPARDYLPGQDAYASPDTFEQSSAEQNLYENPTTQGVYAFAAGNATSLNEQDGHDTEINVNNAAALSQFRAHPQAISPNDPAKQRLFAYPANPATFRAGGAQQLLDEAKPSSGESPEEREQALLAYARDEVAEQVQQHVSLTTAELDVEIKLGTDYCGLEATICGDDIGEALTTSVSQAQGGGGLFSGLANVVSIGLPIVGDFFDPANDLGDAAETDALDDLLGEESSGTTATDIAIGTSVSAEHGAQGLEDILATEDGGTPEDLYAFGNRAGPRGARLSDFGISSPDETVGPYTPTGPADETPGASLFNDPFSSGLSGHYYRLPAGTELPEGYGVVPDGADVGGSQPEGHYTVYPQNPMSYEEFQSGFQNLPFEYGGKIK